MICETERKEVQAASIRTFIIDTAKLHHDNFDAILNRFDIIVIPKRMIADEGPNNTTVIDRTE